MIQHLAVDLIVDHGPFKAELDHHPFQLGNRRFDILHGQGGEPCKAIGPARDHLVNFVVRIPGCGHGNSGIQMVVIESGIGGQDMHVNP
jgi:hypothetical protein